MEKVLPKQVTSHEFLILEGIMGKDLQTISHFYPLCSLTTTGDRNFVTKGL